MTSPFTGHTQVSDNYAQWTFEIGFPPVRRSQSMAYMGWLDSLRGSIGSFTYTPRVPMLGITGVTLAATANPTTNSISVSGYSYAGSAVGYLFGLAGKLYRITSVSGSTISFEPSVKATVAPGASLNFVNPTVELRLVSDDNSGGAGRTIGPDMVMFDSIKATEVL